MPVRRRHIRYWLSLIHIYPDAKQDLVQALEDYLAQERLFVPLWFGTALHAQSPTVSGIDYASSSFSNENVWEWEKQE